MPYNGSMHSVESQPTDSQVQSSFKSVIVDDTPGEKDPRETALQDPRDLRLSELASTEAIVMESRDLRSNDLASRPGSLLKPREDVEANRLAKKLLPKYFHIWVTKLSVVGVSIRHIYRYPNLYVRLSVDGYALKDARIITRTMSPDWNQFYKLRVTKDSIITLEVFDGRDYTQKDLGSLGVVIIRIANVVKEFYKNFNGIPALTLHKLAHKSNAEIVFFLP